MSVFTADDMPPHPPQELCCDEVIHLPPLEFPPLLDPALRDGRGARPDTIHIRQRESRVYLVDAGDSRGPRAAAG